MFHVGNRATRHAVARMLAIEAGLRCTLADLLRGGEGDDAEVSERDTWVSGIRASVDPAYEGKIKSGDSDAHNHIKIGPAQEKRSKK